ncbi:MAG: 4-hydroxy-tetrahydrodipicolinate reductase [Lachnospiraceae bacterium]|nr:4-hydroxy-tetrahydrodipicolinate reductase [Lachnospiraceae bacterium]
MVRIVLCGCSGRMGHVVRSIVDENEDMQIVAGVDIVQGDADFPVFSDASECNILADVIIDFSSPKALNGVLKLAEEKQLAAVLCATGYTPEQLEQINAAAGRIAILRSANMSLGINTMAKLIAEAAKILGNNGYDIEIVERHHNQKLDAPSGTALLLADAMKPVLEGQYEYVYDRSGRRMKRPKTEIGISAVRGGTIVGEHEVIFAGLDEVIEIKHTAYSKAVFAKGAVNAARFLAGKPAGMYTMSNVVE